MKTSNSKMAPRMGLFAVAAAVALLFSACNRADDNRSAGQQVDSAIAKAENKTENAGKEIKESIADATQATKQATVDLKEKAANAADVVADKVGDAAITASVNAELAKDSDLSALKINVDTVGGRVLLKGEAPNAAVRERATQLASSVKGVVEVDNKLQVRS